MFKSVRWKSEKNKIKAEFKLQFHATQVTQLGVDALTLSVVPRDLGRPTAKPEIAKVQDGSCTWENPVYITVKFVRDPKTGKINERIYDLLVSTGSEHVGFLWEVCIDFSKYAETTKPSSLALPLKNSNSNAVLHVCILKTQENFDQREAEMYEDAKIKSQERSLKTFLSFGDTDEIISSNCTKDNSIDITSQSVDLNGNHRASSESDITLSSFDSSSGLDTPRELGTTHNDLPPASDIEIEKLKSEITLLARRADVSELELHTLRKQIVKETRKGQDLSREIVNLKGERDALKAECERLCASQIHVDNTKSKTEYEDEDIRDLLEEIRKELNSEKDQNAILRLQLQKTQECNNELILTVQELEKTVEKMNVEISDLSNRSRSEEEEEEQKELDDIVKEHISTTETYLLEQKVLDLRAEIEIYRRDKDELEMQMEQLALDYEILKQENHDILYKLEQSQLQEQLNIQYEFSGSSYNTINELETQIENLEKELKKQSVDFADSLENIKELESRIASLEEELEKKVQGFEDDLETVTRAKIEQEKRAIRAEEELQKTRWKNADRVKRIQEEFRMISVQMVYAFAEKDKLAMKAVTEASELRLERSKLKEMLRKANDEVRLVREDYEAKIRVLLNQIDAKTSQIEPILSDLTTKTNELERQKKNEKEVCESFSRGIQILKSEIERLQTENNSLTKNAPKNNLIERQRKLTENSLGTSENSSLENEKDLNNKIEELESGLEEKIYGSRSETTVTGIPQEIGTGGEHNVLLAERNQNAASIKSDDGISSEEELKHCTVDNGADNSIELVTELGSLRERNKAMEWELKEIQERYSEISLKFAEVEGERQQLVMSLRNLKNSKK